MTRDPRIDPQPGDKLLVHATEGNPHPNRGGFVREVTRVEGRIVNYIVWRFGYRATLRGGGVKNRIMARIWCRIGTALYRLAGGYEREREPFWGWYLVACGESRAWGERQVMPAKYAMQPRWFSGSAKGGQ